MEGGALSVEGALFVPTFWSIPTFKKFLFRVFRGVGEGGAAAGQAGALRSAGFLTLLTQVSSKSDHPSVERKE